jgi:membrane-bound lytic murein transglycosylase D
VAVPDKDAAVTGRKRVFYRTLPQDTIQDVSVFYRIKPTELQKWNNLDLDARLCGGMVLQLWVPAEFDVSRVALVDPSIVRVVTTGSDEFFDLVEAKRGRARLVYTVKKGDDLKKIGKKYGLTVADLERINRFGEKHSALTVGQKLIVYRSMTSQEREQAVGRLVPGGADVKAPAPPETDPAVDADDKAADVTRPPTDSAKPEDKEAPGGDAIPLKNLPRLP